jgi:hypothetical protein
MKVYAAHLTKRTIPRECITYDRHSLNALTTIIIFSHLCDMYTNANALKTLFRQNFHIEAYLTFLRPPKLQTMTLPMLCVEHLAHLRTS